MATNLHSAVPNVTNTTQPPCSCLPSNCSVYRMSGVSRQAGGGGVRERSPKAVLRLGTGLFLQRTTKPKDGNLSLPGVH